MYKGCKPLFFCIFLKKHGFLQTENIVKRERNTAEYALHSDRTCTGYCYFLQNIYNKTISFGESNYLFGFI